MKERRENERRRWGKKVTYPFVYSEGVLVKKNRRRKIDRREVSEEATTPALTAKSKQENKNTSLDFSECEVMELEEELQNKDKNEPASSIVESIKDLEDEILDAINIEAISKEKFDSWENATPEQILPLKKELKEKLVSKLEKTAKKKVSKKKESSVGPAEIDFPVSGNAKDKYKNISIELIIKGKKHTFTLDKTSCIIGRDPGCDIVIHNKFVSRTHAKILLKEGKFLIEDNSFNGTYLKFNNGQKIHVSKDEQILVSNGVMSMGKPIDDKSKSVIKFKIGQ